MANEEDFYEARLDKIFSKGSMWQHRTLRTVFDLYSTEYHETDMNKKLEILQRIVEAGESLNGIIDEYKERYDENGRNDISRCVEAAVIGLLEYKLSGKNSNSV